MSTRLEDYDKIMKTMPGFIKEMGIELVEVKEKYARGRIDVLEKHLNPFGTVHGGMIFGLCDTIGGIAAMTTGSHVVTLDSSICYLAPAPGTGFLEAEATAIKDGKTTAIYDVIVRTAEGASVAKTTITYFKVGDTRLT